MVNTTRGEFEYYLRAMSEGLKWQIPLSFTGNTNEEGHRLATGALFFKPFQSCSDSEVRYENEYSSVPALTATPPSLSASPPSFSER